MHLTIATRLAWHCEGPTDILLQIEAAATDGQRLVASALDCAPAGHLARVPAQDGIGERIWLHQEGDCAVYYTAEVEVLRRETPLPALAAVPPHRLPGEAVPYLMDSHYCPASRFSPFVDEEFAAAEGGAKIAAMAEWIARHYRYVPGTSNASTTAIDSFVERRGVCRDYAHTLICFGRAAAIPARHTPEGAPPLETSAPCQSRIEALRTDRSGLAAALAGQGFNALVCDHDRLARPDHEALAGGRACLVIDDLADRPLGADIVLDLSLIHL